MRGFVLFSTFFSVLIPAVNAGELSSLASRAYIDGAGKKLFLLCALPFLLAFSNVSANWAGTNPDDYRISDKCKGKEVYSLSNNFTPENDWEAKVNKECRCMQKGGFFSNKRFDSNWHGQCVFWRLSEVEAHFSKEVLDYLQKENGPCPNVINGLNSLTSYKEINATISKACSSDNAGNFLTRFLVSPIDLENTTDQIQLLSMCGADVKLLTSSLYQRDNRLDYRFGESLKKISKSCHSIMGEGTSGTTTRLIAEEKSAKQSERKRKEEAAKAKALAEQRVREEKALAERRRQEQLEKERLAREALAKELSEKRLAERLEAFSGSVPNAQRRIVWGGEQSKKPEARSSNNEIDTFQEINIAYQEALDTASGASMKFDPPKKGEFEKTESYEEHVSNLKREFDSRIKHMKAESERMDIQYFQNAWDKTLGTPEILSLNYDADKERFQIKIGSSAWSGVEGFIHTPISAAPRAKKELLKTTPWVVFDKTSGKLVAVSAFLQFESSIQEARLSRAEIPLRFTKESGNAYAKALQEERTAIQARAARAAARERASWPSGAVAKIRRGATVCTNAKSILRASLIERSGNPYAAMPGDCLTTSGTEYAADVRNIGGSIAKVMIIGGSTYGYASSFNIIR